MGNEVSTINQSQFLSAINRGSFRVHSELAKAEYSLTSNELKIWFLIIASLKDEEHPMYAMSAIDIADKIGITSRRPKGTIISSAFKKLQQQNITIVSQEGENKDPSIYSANFLGEFYYDRKSKIIGFSIPPILHKFLFNLKQNLTLNLSIDDILQLDSATSIRVFIYLRELDRSGIHDVAISEFRKNVCFFENSPYKEYKRRVIKKAVEEIRKLEAFPDFFIEDDGSRANKASMLHFGFELEARDDNLLDDLKPALRSHIMKKFSRRIQILIDFAVKEGFNPAYIKDKFDSYDVDYIEKNCAAVFDRIRKDKASGVPKTPEDYGRYFIAAVQGNWAKAKPESYQQRADDRIRNAELQQRMKDITEQEQFQNAALFARKQAKEYISNMPYDMLAALIKKNKKELDILAKHGRPFDIVKAYSRNKSYREFRLLSQLIAGKMMSGEIKMEKPTLQSSLF